MRLDGYDVEVGDQVYCLKNRWGKVAHVSETFIEVRFMEAGTNRYTVNGEYGVNKIRTLYWHDPVFIKPPKPKEDYRRMVDLIAAVSRVFRIKI